jgi:hypothetical protein
MSSALSRRRRSGLIAAVAAAGLLAAAGPATASVPLPTVSQINPAPPAPQTPATGALQDLGARGYAEKEYRVTLTSPQVYSLATAGDNTTGTAAAAPASPFGAYRSRILVRAPQDPADFNGRVVVEVMNATTGVDLDIHWQQSYEYLMDSGAIYVGVAAQPRTLFAATVPPPTGASRLAARYAGQNLTLSTPAALGAGAAGLGDPSLAWDLISQVGQLVKSETGPFSGYDVSSVVAAGWSQSAGYLTTYANVIQRLHDVYDGFLLGARGGNGTSLQFPTGPNVTVTGAQGIINTGTDAPVINLQTETDSKSTIIRKADSDAATDRFRLWEVPGSAHNDEWSARQAVDIIVRDTFVPGLPGCSWTGDDKITDNPVRYTLNAATEALADWAETGTGPASQARITAPDGASNGALIVPPNVLVGGPDGISRDALGNAQGGVRTPFVDVASRSFKPFSPGPIAAFCTLTGRERALTIAEANGAYADYSAYLSAFETSLDGAIAAGTLLAGDRPEALAEGANAYTVRPDAPAETAGDAAGTGSFTVGWKGPNPATPEPFTVVTYELERSDDGGATWDSLGTALSSRSYEETGPLPDGTYEYRVRTKAVTSPPQHPNAPITAQSDWSAAGTIVVDKFGFAVGQPINANGSSIFKLGRTIPVKITLTDENGAPVTGEELRLSLAKLTDEVEGTVVESGFETGNANEGNLFRETGAGEYVFNLSTRGLEAGTYNVRATTEDGSIFRVKISLL